MSITFGNSIDRDIILCYSNFTKMIIKQAEKRKYTRMALDLPLRYKIRGQSEFGTSVTKDISFGGLRFSGDRYLKPSAEVMLEINILSKVINPIGRIKWSQHMPHSNRCQVGVEFIELSPGNRNYLAHYMSLKLRGTQE